MAPQIRFWLHRVGYPYYVNDSGITVYVINRGEIIIIINTRTTAHS